jgi:predicted transcriptional regulator
MRTLIDLPDAQIQALATLCERMKQPRAAIIREAVAEYLERRATKPAEAAYGLWGAEAMDGLAYQEKVRSEW